MKYPATNAKLVSIAIVFLLLFSGCAFQNRDSDLNTTELSPKESPVETLGSNDFKLISVKQIIQIKPSEVLTFSCEFIVARPTEATPNCADFGIAIGDIKWKTWRASGAVGTGVYFANDCKPNCAEGKVFQTPVLINLDGLFTDGQRYFLRYLTFADVGEQPQAQKATGTWDLAEFFLEKADLREDKY